MIDFLSGVLSPKIRSTLIGKISVGIVQVKIGGGLKSILSKGANLRAKTRLVFNTVNSSDSACRIG